MNETILTPIVDILDVIGIAVFALSGALIAARERQSFVTMCFFALVTGVGGGTVRDLLIGAPVFWMFDPWVAPVCLLTAFVAWFFPGRIWDGRLFFFADGAGLAAFSVLGSAKAVAYGITPVPAVLMGVITGVVGGIIRDVVAGRPSVLMQPQIYLTAAILSSMLTVIGAFGAEYFAFPEAVAWAVAFLVGFIVRCAAIEFRWRWPRYGKGKKIDPMPASPDEATMDEAGVDDSAASEAEVPETP